MRHGFQLVPPPCMLIKDNSNWWSKINAKMVNNYVSRICAVLTRRIQIISYQCFGRGNVLISNRN